MVVFLFSTFFFSTHAKRMTVTNEINLLIELINDPLIIFYTGENLPSHPHTEALLLLGVVRPKVSPSEV